MVCALYSGFQSMEERSGFGCIRRRRCGRQPEFASAMADLNRFEAEIRGEFDIGSAAQYGSANRRKAVHVNENLKRANFTSADMRESDFSGLTFNGAYLETVVANKANFTGIIG